MNGDKTTETYAAAIAMRHGGLFFGHNHYDILFLEVPADMPKELVREAALDSFKITHKVLGMKAKLLELKKVEKFDHKDQLRKILGGMFKGPVEVTVHREPTGTPADLPANAPRRTAAKKAVTKRAPKKAVKKATKRA